MATIDSLVVEIDGKATQATQGIDGLVRSLRNLQNTTAGQLKGLNNISKGLDALTGVMKDIAELSAQLDSGNIQSLNQMTQALMGLSNLKDVKISTSIANQLKAIGEATRGLVGTDYGELQRLGASLSTLTGINKASGLNSIANTLLKIPDAIKGINEIDSSTIATFTQRVEELRQSILPLANEMRAVSAGFSALPSNIQKAIKANQKLTASNNSTYRSTKRLLSGVVSVSAVYFGMRKIFNLAMDVFEESNNYVESLNLAEVAMGKFADQAQRYAETVEEVIGINQSEWLTNMGTFNQMLAGFGIDQNKTSKMSQQLVQLGYDIQSVFNVKDVSQVMDRLQSGLAGQIKGMREYGVELSVAAMQEYALSQGITQSWSSMSQAQKVALRYSKIMESTKNIQGDLARTLITPANSLRLLSSQWQVAQRYMGQFVSVIAARVIPMVQTLVAVVSAAARALAALWGYALPSISFVGDTSAAIGGIADSLDDVGASAGGAGGKMKGLLADFDELNIIQSESGGGGGGGAAEIGAIGDLWNLTDYSYNFLDGVKAKTDSIISSVSAWLNKWSPAVYGLMAGIGTFLGTNLLANWAIAAWDTVQGAGGLLKYLRQMKKGTAIALGIAGLTAGFITMEGAMEKILSTENGWAKYWDVFTLGLVEAVGVGALSGFAIGGPIGAVVGGLAGVAVGVASVLKAFDNVKQARLHDEFMALFGDVSLTEAQVKSLSDTLTYSPFYAKAELALAGFETAEQSITKARTDLENLSSAHWLISLGVMTGDEAQSTFKENLDAAVLSLQNFVNENGYAVKIMTDLTYGEGSEESERVGRITANMNTFLADLGQQAQDAFNAAWEDGLYTFDEQQIVKNLLQQISDVQARLNRAYGAGEVASMMMGLNFDNLDWESRNAVYQNVISAIEGYRQEDEKIRAATAGGLSAIAEEALIALEADPTNAILKADYDAAIKDYQDFVSGVSETSIALDENLRYWDDMASGFAKDIFLTDDVVEHFSNAFKSVNDAFSIEDWYLMDWSTMADSIMRNIENGVPSDRVKGEFDNFFIALSGEFMRGMSMVSNSINQEDAKALWDNVSPWMADQKSILAEARSNGEAVTNAYRNEMMTAARAGAASGDMDMRQYLFGSMLFDTGVSSKLLDSVELDAEMVGDSFGAGYLDSLNIAQNDVGQWYIDFGNGQTELISGLSETMKTNLANMGLELAAYLQDANPVNTTEAQGVLDSSTEFANELKTNMGDAGPLSYDAMNGSISDELGYLRNKTNDLASIADAWEKNRARFGGGIGSAVGGFIGGIIGGIKKQSMPIESAPRITIPAFAGGGFPTEGQLFIANEQGPELVGRIGGQTAVANNDQIVNGIASGVSNANSRLEAKMDEFIRIGRQLLAKEGNVVIQPSAAMGRVVQKSSEMYQKARG